jgi:hypothetical protein
MIDSHHALCDAQDFKKKGAEMAQLGYHAQS